MTSLRADGYRLRARMICALLVLVLILSCPLFPQSAHATSTDIASTSIESADVSALIDEGNAVADEIVVVYEDETVELGEALEGGDTVEGIVEQEKIADPSDDIGAIEVVRIAEETDIASAMVELEADPAVAYVEPNYVFKGYATKVNDPFASDQYYLQSSGFLEAWDYARSEHKVTVAVFDDGCLYAHPDLKDNVDAVHAYDAVNDQHLESTAGASGHGTGVAGVIGAVANNGHLIAGASYNAEILPFNVFKWNGDATYADVLVACEELKRLIDTGSVKDVRVLNLSFGAYLENDDGRALHTQLQILRNEYGILPVSAGGNGDRVTGQPITDKSYPADYDEVVSVTSLQRDGANSTWSDYNEYKDIGAPGEGILTTSATGGIYSLDGTSVAAPIVSSAAALLWSVKPDLTVDQVESALKGTATKITANARPTSGSAGALDIAAAARVVSGGKKIPTIESVSTNEMYRMYNPISGEHFYTESGAERNHLIVVGWRYEGIAWNAPKTGSPVYRLYNPNAGDHHYTLSAVERDHLVSVGWRYEGIGWRSASSQGVSLYRLYNSNAISGAHHYTTSSFESQSLQYLGWSYEGIGWYGSE